MPALLRSLLVAFGLVVLGTAPVQAASLAGGCSNSSASAADQYCETLPTAGGGHAAVIGSARLAATLPRSAVAELARSKVGQGVAVLPAAVSAVSSAGPTSPASLSPRTGAITVSGWSLALPLIVTLALIALLVGALAVRKARRSPRPQT